MLIPALAFHSSDSSEYKHRTLSERSSKNLRKQRLVLPQPLDKFEEYHEEAEFGYTQMHISESFNTDIFLFSVKILLYE